MPAAQCAARPRLVGAIGMLDSARGGLEGRVARLLQEECNTMTRMNRTTLVAAGLFGLTVCAVMLVINVQAAENSPEEAAREAVYAKVILPVDKPVTSEYPLEPWISEDLAARKKPDFAAMSDWTDSRYPQWVPNTAKGKANFAAVSDWTRVDEKPAGAQPTMIWFGGQLACPAVARYGARTADGNLTIELSGFSPGDARGQGSLPPEREAGRSWK